MVLSDDHIDSEHQITRYLLSHSLMDVAYLGMEVPIFLQGPLVIRYPLATCG